MHRYLPAGLLACVLLAGAGAASASDSLRVGSRVLVVGDSAATVADLLGKPSHKSHRSAARSGSRRGKHVRVVSRDAERGEQWQYRRDGRVVVVTLVDGRVSDIDERSR
ncbi:MAG: hypothetical protein BGP10_02590 [Rhodanobacter sp. 68-29]|uniref:DUF2845 domain-containing protein n=1 Tax=Rhodanobacter sp. PCA2 TaxID=2006117 RepID=UPI00086A4191|nr:DUF2845 domain-containing protein [Rhodanobacter sp. PCA2]MBA2080143.1 hypothetical protein [Rhodanobacter sp. PCA2]MBN8923077.1 DUF2845 domain-containing protein [Rhodanobacter sp.]ODU74868.1 MAG: hypothetical protein ABT17_06395 [Rhodanobacter sp. SCN 69-32]OJY58530.1 MAG: hypothetical protein BGP10_02590 [Rhodanobacter sp. 68-29]